MINQATMFKISNVSGAVGTGISAALFSATAQNFYLYILIADAILTFVSLCLGIFAGGIAAVKDAKKEESDGGKKITFDEWTDIIDKSLGFAKAAKSAMDDKVKEVKDATDVATKEGNNDAKQ